MTARLSAVVLDDCDGRALAPEVEQERNVAIFDLLEENAFALPGAPEGPYRLALMLDGRALVFDLTTEDGAPAARFEVSVGPLAQIAKDYRQICETYAAAVTSKTPGEIEALDEARRAIHDEGADALGRRLGDHVEMDAPTAKRLFTLVYVLTSGA